ncbi:hypothetical protein Chor_003004 [Crotalus horridus]
MNRRNILVMKHSYSQDAADVCEIDEIEEVPTTSHRLSRHDKAVQRMQFMHGGGEFGGKGVEEEKVLLVPSHENTQVSDSVCKESKMVLIYIFRHLLELIV